MFLAFKRKYFCGNCGKELIVNPKKCSACAWSKPNLKIKK